MPWFLPIEAIEPMTPPAVEADYLAAELTVPLYASATLFVEMPAVDGVEGICPDADYEHQNGVEDEPVERGHRQQEDRAQLEDGLDDAAVGVDLHLLLRGDKGLEGDRNDAGKEREDAKLIDPARRVHTVGGDVHLPLEYPEAHGLGQKQYHQRYRPEDDDVHPEHFVEGGVVLLPELDGVVAVAGSVHHAVEEGERNDYSADYVVQSEIRFAQDVEHHAGSVETDYHYQSHPQAKNRVIWTLHTLKLTH